MYILTCFLLYSRVCYDLRVRKYEVDRIFIEVAAELELEDERKRQEAFTCEARPLPEELQAEGLPLGHVVFQGDFDEQ
jgi:hypothetical protein